MIEILLLCWAAEEVHAPAPEAVLPPPSLELLEYLGRYEDSDGEFMDPMLLEEPLGTPQRRDDENRHDDSQSDSDDAAAAGPERRR